MPSILQRNIKYHLKKQRLSAAELERQMGVPHAIINILHGRSKNPTIRVAQAIAKALGCSVEELLTEPQPESQGTFLSQGTAFKSKAEWDPDCYEKVTEMVKTKLQEMQIQLDFASVHNCIGEIYLYMQESRLKEVDPHFVQWLLKRFCQ